jgi:translation initiation factor 1
MAEHPSDRTRLAYSTSEGAIAVPRTLAVELDRETRGARIRLERRASGRVVTVIADLPGTASDLEALAKLLKTRCGTGGSVKDLQIELQGDKRDGVQTVLREKRIPHKLAGG